MGKVEVYLDSEASIDERVEDLLSKMTLEEKIGQLKAGFLDRGKIFSDIQEGLSDDQKTRILFFAVLEGKDTFRVMTANYVKKHWKEVLEKDKHGIGMYARVRDFSPKEGAQLANQIQEFVLKKSRLRIPLLIYENCAHGVTAKGSVVFPVLIALASSWNPELMKQVSTVIGREMKVRGLNQCMSPTVNIARDPRNGRVQETCGEDPYLSSVMGVNFVAGVQSQRVIAAPRLFAVNFVGDGGRDSNAIHFSERIMREVYLPAFKACIQKANALSVMESYNSIDGVPVACNKWLLTDVLRGEWGFKGFVVADFDAVLRLYTLHKVAETKAEAAKKCIEAGLDIELPDTDCYEELLKLVKEGQLSEKVIDESVRRFLKTKFWTGLFDHPYVDPEYAEKICDCEEHRKLALRAAREAIVLLKNDGILPLSKGLRSIAIIGPNADKMELGNPSAYGVRLVAPLDGIKGKVSGSTEVLFARGCGVTGSSREGFAEAVKMAERSDVAVLFVGNSDETEGERRDRCNLDLPGVQEDLIRTICGTETPVVVVLINGSAVTMTNWIDKVHAVVEAWYPGEEGGNAIGDVLFGDYNPSGKLPITFPKMIGQLPLYYNYKPTGRVYDYVDLRGRQPLFAFGHGLSYTEFEYGNLGIEPEKTGAEGKVNVSVDVKNVGKCKGDEVVQLYIHDAVATIAKPVKELKGFERITLEPGEKKTVDFNLTSEDLASYDMNMNLVVEPGIFEVMIGSSSEDIRLKGSFEIA